jgi:hypothetical protein
MKTNTSTPNYNLIIIILIIRDVVLGVRIALELVMAITNAPVVVVDGGRRVVVVDQRNMVLEEQIFLTIGDTAAVEILRSEENPLSHVRSGEYLIKF